MLLEPPLVLLPSVCQLTSLIWSVVRQSGESSRVERVLDCMTASPYLILSMVNPSFARFDIPYNMRAYIQHYNGTRGEGGHSLFQWPAEASIFAAGGKRATSTRRVLCGYGRIKGRGRGRGRGRAEIRKIQKCGLDGAESCGAA